MASSRIRPFPLSGVVPYQGALYTITHGEVFSGDRLYHLVRGVGSGTDRRFLVNHWIILRHMEQSARYKVGDAVLHSVLGRAIVTARAWRFDRGVVVYHVREVSGSGGPVKAFEHELRSVK